jgi:hypothetical protein
VPLDELESDRRLKVAFPPSGVQGHAPTLV